MKFPYPLPHNSRRAHNKRWLCQHVAVFEASEEGNGLAGFAEAHFVANDAAVFERVQLPEPFNAYGRS